LQSSDANHIENVGIHEVQAPREEDPHRQTVILTDLTYMDVFVSRLCYKNYLKVCLRDARQLLIMEATGQLINNKTSRFISCNICVLFFSALSQIIFGFRHTRSCQTDCTLFHSQRDKNRKTRTKMEKCNYIFSILKYFYYY